MTPRPPLPAAWTPCSPHTPRGSTWSSSAAWCRWVRLRGSRVISSIMFGNAGFGLQVMWCVKGMAGLTWVATQSKLQLL